MQTITNLDILLLPQERVHHPAFNLVTFTEMGTCTRYVQRLYLSQVRNAIGERLFLAGWILAKEALTIMWRITGTEVHGRSLGCRK